MGGRVETGLDDVVGDFADDVAANVGHVQVEDCLYTLERHVYEERRHIRKHGTRGNVILKRTWSFSPRLRSTTMAVSTLTRLKSRNSINVNVTMKKAEISVTVRANECQSSELADEA